MGYIVTEDVELKHDSLTVIPLGGQSELGQMLWVVTYGGEMLLIDAGASYPAEDLPGVDLLLPNTNFLEANKGKIQALLLTNGHEEHCGAVPYLLRHIPIPRIMGPRFVSAFLHQSQQILTYQQSGHQVEIDTIEPRQSYSIGPFEVEWIHVNDAIADACALRIGSPAGTVIYTSSFKLDQTPVDKRLLDVGRLAEIGNEGVLLLISASAGVENPGYTASEKSVEQALHARISQAKGRVIVVMPGTNTHRLQILFDLARSNQRKVLLLGEVLIRAAVAAAVSGSLVYDRTLEAKLNDLKKLSDRELLIVATGIEGDPMDMLVELATGMHPDITSKEGDLVIFSAPIQPGRSRQLATMLDQFLTQGVKVIYGDREHVHVAKHASREELKLMLSIICPTYFVPAFGEGRHIMHHAQLAMDWGLPADSVFPLKNGEILSISNGLASVLGAVESQAVLLNRDQGERVTTFSVKERRVLSMEGVITISLVIDQNGNLVSGPAIDAGGSAFLNSTEWQETRSELHQAMIAIIDKQLGTIGGAQSDAGDKVDFSQLRSALREAAVKMLRARLQAKPAVQVVIQQLASPGSFNK
ncbi:MAG: hypothetical protein C5B53_09815 [Candidatus Melainabacteria bacterium]|nr:MAG: hypothetical protein C5B53_09815 [Candidatus Melainabacteria bacterium]